MPRLCIAYVPVLIALAANSWALQVPNASFENPSRNGKGPSGWRFEGNSELESGSWATEAPFCGERIVRLDARRGSVSWESSDITVAPGREYLLHWMARFSGEKVWRFRADFCGVEVEFHDSAGLVVGASRQHTHCWQTVGWRPAWFVFTPPPQAANLRIRFSIESPEPLPGGFDVDLVELRPLHQQTPEHEGNHLLNLEILDEDGNPTAARVRIERELEGSANPVILCPSGAIAFDCNEFAFHPLREGVVQLEVPPGRYTFQVAKGFEYSPVSRTIEVAGRDVSEKVSLERVHDWSQRKWFCGDHQVHLYRHGGSLYPSLTWRDVVRSAKCEGLEFLPFMGADRYPEDARSLRAVTDRGEFAYELTNEITDDFWGHVCPIGAPYTPREDTWYVPGMMNFDRNLSLDRDGGVLCYAHPYGPLQDATDDLLPVAKFDSGLLSREFPVDLALRMGCAFDLLTMEGDMNRLDRMIGDLYRLYNLGFRPGLGASTDFHLDQGRQAFGAVRTYVHVRKLNLDTISEAYREGRTFVTNGPLVDLQVEGVGPGQTVFATAGQPDLPVHVDARSLGRLDRVEIVVNGRVYAGFLESSTGEIAAECKIPVRKSFWVAARVSGPPDPLFASELEGRPVAPGQFAHTSPVYVFVDDQPILDASPEDAEYFWRWCDATLYAWKSRLKQHPEEASHDSRISARIGRARTVFSDLKKRIAGE